MAMKGKAKAKAKAKVHKKAMKAIKAMKATAKKPAVVDISTDEEARDPEPEEEAAEEQEDVEQGEFVTEELEATSFELAAMRHVDLDPESEEEDV